MRLKIPFATQKLTRETMKKRLDLNLIWCDFTNPDFCSKIITFTAREDSTGHGKCAYKPPEFVN